MIRLTVIEPKMELKTVEFSRDIVTIGRSSRNVIRLRDSKVSSTHCQLVRIEDSWVVCDLNSKNGTFIDGLKIGKTPVREGQTFTLGFTSIRIEPMNGEIRIMPAVEARAVLSIDMPAHEMDEREECADQPESRRRRRKSLFQWVRSAPALLLSIMLHCAVLGVLSIIAFSTKAFDSNGKIEVTLPPMKLDDAALGKVDNPLDKNHDLSEEMVSGGQPADEEPRDSAWAKAAPFAFDPNMDAGSPSDTTGISGASNPGFDFASKINVRRRSGVGGPSGSSGKAVGKALEWLARHQSADGGWHATGFSEACVEEVCEGPGRKGCDIGLTGLALLAFLGAGHSQVYGDHRETVLRALKYLRDKQDSDGCFGEKRGKYIYNHVIATLAVAKCHADTQSPNLVPMTESAVQFLRSVQADGSGWRYIAGKGDSDTSVTAWSVLALAWAQKSQIRVPESVFSGAQAWLDVVRNPATGHYGYHTKEDLGARLESAVGKFPAKPAMTAAGRASMSIICRLLKRNNPKEGRSVGEMCGRPEWNVDAGSIDMYYWFFGALATNMEKGAGSADWADSVRNVLVKNQVKSGKCAVGSWDAVDAWSSVGGRVYSTAICAMALEASFAAFDPK